MSLCDIKEEYITQCYDYSPVSYGLRYLARVDSEAHC